MDQWDIAEDTDVDVVYREILEGPRPGDVFEELFAVSGDARSLHDEVFGEELLEACGVACLIGSDVVVVELIDDR